MPKTTTFPVPSGYQAWYAYGTSNVGLQKRREFAGNILSVVGDARVLWVPLVSDTTSSTTLDSNARTVTWTATIASLFTQQGSGSLVSFDGTAPTSSIPDATNLSFGDAVNDEAFSVFAWFTTPGSGVIKDILSKYDLTTGVTKREWAFFVDAANKLNIAAWDESAAASISVLYNTAVALSSNVFACATYDGSRAESGLKQYLWDGTAAGLVANTSASAGSYVAMENTAATVIIGAETGASATVRWWNGKLGTVCLAAGALTLSQIVALKQLGNGYYGWTL